MNWLLMLEIVGTAMGVTEVLLARANKVLLYPFGIAGILISSFIYFESSLYAHCLLNMYYLIMSIYGWYFWVNKHNNKPVLPSYSKRSDWKLTIIIVVVGFILLQYLLRRFTDSDVPYWDAWVSATAWAGMWLLSKRKIENWILLNISNAFAVPLLIHKGYFLYASLTAFLFIIAISGYFKWRKQIVQYKANYNNAQ